MITELELINDATIAAIATTASEAFVAAMLNADTVASIKAEVTGNVYWPHFVALVADGAVPEDWLQGAMGPCVLGWASQKVSHV